MYYPNKFIYHAGIINNLFLIMSLKFKGNKSVKDILQKSKLIKKEKQEPLVKFSHEDLTDF